MSDIIDIVTRLTYELQGQQNLDKAVTSLNNQAKSIENLNKQLKEQQKYYSQAQNAQQQEIAQRAIGKTTQQINKQTEALKQNFYSNKQIQSAMKEEIGVINQLTQYIKRAKEERATLTDINQIKKYTSEIQEAQKKLNSLTTIAPTTSKIFGGSLGSTILQGLGIGTGAALVTQGISALSGFLSESGEIAKEVQGIELAFNRLNKPGLLDNLRTATKGTVSDLQLMKQAVNANNFQIPLERLGSLFSFARQRARDTGESVDYLVNSITTGIARRSPLILDNLGINIKRVREEFQKTGDFAQAAFNIIDEEAAKAGESIDLFADKTDRLAARQANLQSAVGKVYNAIKEQIINTLAGVNPVIAAQEAALDKVNEFAAEIEKERQETADYYLKKYINSDKTGRDVLYRQASEYYDKIQSLESQALDSGLDRQAKYYRGLLAEVQKFFLSINKLSNAPKGLRDMSLDELEQEKRVRQEFLSKIPVSDTKEIGISKARVKEVQDLIDLFTNKPDKDAESAAKKAEKLREEIRKLAHQINGTSWDVKDDMQKYFKELDENAERARKSIEKFFNETINEMLKRDILSELGSQLTTAQANELSRILTANSKTNSEKRKKKYGTDNLEDISKMGSDKTAAIFGEDTRRITDPEERRREEIQKSIEAYSQLTQAAVSGFNTIYEAQANLLDREIAIREKRVETAVQLAARGNTEILKQEQERLDESIRQREIVARRQQQINALLAVSESVVAVAHAAAQSGTGAIVIVPAVIAAILAGFAAVSSVAREAALPAFAEGVENFQGKGTGTSDSNVVRLSHGESVLTAKATQMYAGIPTAMNNGTFQFAEVGRSGSGGVSMKETNKKLDMVVSRLDNLEFRAENKIDGYGVHQLVEANRMAEKRKWKNA